MFASTERKIRNIVRNESVEIESLRYKYNYCVQEMSRLWGVFFCLLDELNLTLVDGLPYTGQYKLIKKRKKCGKEKP